MKFTNFTGINNVQPSERLGEADLAQAVNVDVGLSGEVSRRQGFTTLDSAMPVAWLHERKDCTLVVSGSDLIAVSLDGLTKATLLTDTSLATSRTWFTDLPDGRTGFANGVITGITDGVTVTGWGVAVPATVGTATSVTGQLNQGAYQWQITYVRTADGLESGAAFSTTPINLPDGGILLTGLPALAGHRINVYLTGVNGDKAFYAGTTLTGSFSYLGKNDALTLPCHTEHLAPAPKGTICATWRGRVLLAEGNVLHASRPHQPELFDLKRDFKQFTAPITMVQPVDDGIWVGTEKELAFLAGAQFDALQFTPRDVGPVVLGSGVSAPGEYVAQGQGTGQGAAMLCIAGGRIVSGFNGGLLINVTRERYQTDAAEVCASFRITGGVPQYVAIPR